MKLAYALVTTTILCGVYGQMILKWQAGRAGELPGAAGSGLSYLLKLLVNPWVLTSLAAAVVALFAWMGALSRLDLSRVYPFVSASFVLVLICSAIFFDEALTTPKVVGALLIVVGLIVGSQG
jgi:multidrug transporter EmrE-like cation transporter